MSQPIDRYDLLVNDCDRCYIGIDTEGLYVLHSDYAALAADRDVHIKALRDEVDCVREENAALTAENERLNKNIAVLVDELATVSAKVEWLRKAEHLVIWDGEKWVVRQEQCPGSIANKPFPY